jgi:hypothetical protein
LLFSSKQIDVDRWYDWQAVVASILLHKDQREQHDYAVQCPGSVKTDKKSSGPILYGLMRAMWRQPFASPPLSITVRLPAQADGKISII